ncbi:GtrA family protein [Aquirufa aurantiipilula]|uniref:GtrA family protein n=1 Tax=Aquirufa aurantiipilula TaxID=2696561 RepID=A0ABT6BPF8_9BACT|nr:GtrA family protein [Aquirufa aurantiipilula]MBZ1327333.1 GtrA family protein [Aquirufa aurantiipilula]MDF5690988.1 GtrA family protein [Aquirufa aurantiipilula]
MSKSNSKLFNKKDLLAYFLIAGTGAVVQLVAGGLIKDWFKVSYEESILPAYYISLVVGFILTKLFAFNARQSQQTRREMIKFLMVASFSGFVTWFFSVLPYRGLHSMMNDISWQIPYSVKKINLTQVLTTINGMGFSFVSNYVLHKSFTFKSSGFYDRFKDLIR